MGDIIGQDPVRGNGGKYCGPERRAAGKRQCCREFIHRAPYVSALKERECLTCINMIDGKCVIKAFTEHQK